MSGEGDLSKLLKTLAPLMRPELYVFCSVKDGQDDIHRAARPFATVAEEEGLTLVLAQEQADQRGLFYRGVFRCITLQVHSSLEAVGLTAAVAAKLAAHQISANVIAGFYHDHVLVPSAKAEQALQLLTSLSIQASEERLR
jgi:uncharacterized protein